MVFKSVKSAGHEDILLLATLINQTVGDAFSDMLAIEAVLHLLGYTVHDWFNMYNDFPNRLMKVLRIITNPTKVAYTDV